MFSVVLALAAMLVGRAGLGLTKIRAVTATSRSDEYPVNLIVLTTSMPCAPVRKSRSGNYTGEGVTAFVSRRAPLSIVTITVCAPFFEYSDNRGECLIKHSHSYVMSSWMVHCLS